MIEIGIVGLLASADLLIKGRIEKEPQENFPRSLPCSKGWITLQKFHNDGFPFGFLREHFFLVKAASLTVTSAVMIYLCRLIPRKGYQMEKAAMVLVLGGALSNLYDRFVRQYVVDYFTIEAGRLKKVIFNLGDIFVFIGSALFLLASVRDDLRS